MKLKKTVNNIFSFLLGEATLVPFKHLSFSEARKDVEDKGHDYTVIRQTNANVEKLKTPLRIYHLGFRTTAWDLNMNQKMVRQILK
jgi:hypothetical protein